MPDDYYELGGEAYGLLSKTTGTVGYALAEDTTGLFTMLDSVETHEGNGVKTLFVPQDADPAMWTFENVASDRYRLKLDSGGHLAVSGDTLTFSDTADDTTTAFQVRPQADGSKQAANLLQYEDDPTVFNYRLYLKNGTSDALELASLQRYYVLDPQRELCVWDTETQKFLRYQVNVQTLSALNDTEQQEVIFDGDVPEQLPGGDSFTATALTAEEKAAVGAGEDDEKYIVRDAEGYLCVYDTEAAAYVRYLKSYQNAADLSEDERQKVTFHTSQYGAISNIPAGYTVRVPGLVAGTLFCVEEREYEIPVGYGLMDYECGKERIDGEDGQASYIMTDPEHPNYGEISAKSDAHMIVSNQRGFGIRADKIWSDSDFADGHGTIYTAMYLGDSEEPLPGFVKCIHSDETSVQYFYRSLESGYSISDYHIFEVALTNAQEQADGRITYDSLTKLAEHALLSAHSVTDHNGGETTDDYTVSYNEGTPVKTVEGLAAPNARTDSIRNTRKGGLAINLYRWNTGWRRRSPREDISA